MTDTFERLKAALADRYTVERELGSGGMATVYLAQDVKHHRPVAVKVLRPELAATLGPERFLREIQIAARLTHPHILPLYDSGEANGFLYYVMPYVEGETLRDRLDREKQLPLDDALQLAREVADALSYAHSHDVIHRDIKPENILLESGHAVVADFGIARAITAAGGEKLTETGIAVGTPSYMSPEQAAGSKDLDGRSDLYGLGCVLYEMLAGQPPFTGPTVESIVQQHLTTEPPSVTKIRPAVPAMVAAALARALAKTPADRFSPVGQFAEALADATATPALRSDVGLAAVPPEKSIAVLPFANIGADPENEYFSDGITEDVIAQLSKIGELRVISRTSVMQYKERRDKRLRQIGEELNVAAILEGTVRRDGSRVRIVAQLIDAKADQHLWAETYDRELTDIFTIQSDVAQQIGSALKATLSPEERKRIERKPTDNLEAYTLYLKGRYFWNKRTEQGVKKGLEYFNQAIDRDPDYALAHTGAADSYITLAYYSAVVPKEGYPRAKAAAIKALEIDETLAGAHTALAAVKHDYEWDWPGAEREFKRGIELNQSYATGHHWYGVYLTAMGRLDEARKEMKRAQELDPVSLIINAEVGWPSYYGRQYGEAIEQYRKTIDMDPDFAVARYFLGQAYEQKGMFDEAIGEFQKARTLSGGDTYAIAALGRGYALAGRRDEAQRLLDEMEELSQRRYVSPYRIAEIYAGLGEKDRAFECLEKAHDERSVSLIFLKVEPSFDSLRSDPRFIRLLKKIGLG